MLENTFTSFGRIEWVIIYDHNEYLQGFRMAICLVLMLSCNSCLTSERSLLREIPGQTLSLRLQCQHEAEQLSGRELTRESAAIGNNTPKAAYLKLLNSRGQENRCLNNYRDDTPKHTNPYAKTGLRRLTIKTLHEQQETCISDQVTRTKVPVPL